MRGKQVGKHCKLYQYSLSFPGWGGGILLFFYAPCYEVENAENPPVVSQCCSIRCVYLPSLSFCFSSANEWLNHPCHFEHIEIAGRVCILPGQRKARERATGRESDAIHTICMHSWPCLGVTFQRALATSQHTFIIPPILSRPSARACFKIPSISRFTIARHFSPFPPPLASRLSPDCSQPGRDVTHHSDFELSALLIQHTISLLWPTREQAKARDDHHSHRYSDASSSPLAPFLRWLVCSFRPRASLATATVIYRRILTVFYLK